MLTPLSGGLTPIPDGREDSDGLPSRDASTGKLIESSVNMRDLATASRLLKAGQVFRSSQVISGKEMKALGIKVGSRRERGRVRIGGGGGDADWT